MREKETTLDKISNAIVDEETAISIIDEWIRKEAAIVTNYKEKLNKVCELLSDKNCAV